MRARGWLLIVAALVAVLLLVGRTVTALMVDHAWFAAMGVPGLFWEQVIDSVVLQGGAWIVGTLFAWANLHAVRRTILAVAVPSRVANLELTAMVPGQRLAWLTLVGAAIIGATLALPLTNWSDLALARHGLPFGEIEGILDRDLGFYVYWLPVEETLYLWALVNVVAVTALVLVLYALTRSLRLEGRRLAASNHVRRHLSVLGALVLLLLAWSYRLDAFDLLQQGSGPDGQFLRVDHRVTLRIDFVLSYGCAIAAAVLVRTGWVGQLRAAFVTLSLVLIGALGLRNVAPPLLARGDLLGDPAKRDEDYLASRTLFSRRAYDVDAMRLGADSAGATANAATASASTATASSANASSANRSASNVSSASTSSATTAGAHASGTSASGPNTEAARAAGERAPFVARDRLAAHTSLWDRVALGQALGESASPTSDGPPPIPADGAGNRMVDAAPIGWTTIDGRLTALVVRRPVASGERWRLFAADATRAVLRDSLLEVETGLAEQGGGAWPLVGPGLDGARLIDGAAAAEIPAPTLARRRDRIAHAWALRDISLLDADTAAGGAPLLVTHRDVRDRVQRLAPIFTQGADVLPVRDGGRLYWTVQLYSASDHYPLSQRWVVNDRWVGYFKLAATALVDAATGRVQLIPALRPDPIARTWMTRLPTLFTPARSLSPTLASQLPPATESGIVQVRTFARFGSRLEGPVAHRVPDSLLTHGSTAPYLVGDTAAPVLAWSVPLLDGTEQLDGVITVTGGAERVVWWQRVPEPRARWTTLSEPLRAVAESAHVASAGLRRDARLRSSEIGAVVTDRGPVLLQTVQWVRPDGGTVVARVGVTDGVRLGVGATLGDALAAIGIRSRVQSEKPAGSALAPTDRDAGRLYDLMRRALQRGDWAAFGAAFDSLGLALKRPPP